MNKKIRQNKRGGRGGGKTIKRTITEAALEIEGASLKATRPEGDPKTD